MQSQINLMVEESIDSEDDHSYRVTENGEFVRYQGSRSGASNNKILISYDEGDNMSKSDGIR